MYSSGLVLVVSVKNIFRFIRKNIYSVLMFCWPRTVNTMVVCVGTQSFRFLPSHRTIGLIASSFPAATASEFTAVHIHVSHSEFFRQKKNDGLKMHYIFSLMFYRPVFFSKDRCYPCLNRARLKVTIQSCRPAVRHANVRVSLLSRAKNVVFLTVS